MAPRRIRPVLSLAWRGNVFPVQSFRDCLQRATFGSHLENPSHYCGFRLIDLQTDGGGSVGPSYRRVFYIVVAIAPSPRVQPLERMFTLTN